MKIKNFLSRIYLFFLMLFSYNPIKPAVENFETFSPNGKRQSIAKGVERNTKRAFDRAMGFESFDDLEGENLEGLEDYEEMEEAYENLRKAGHPSPNKAMSKKYGRKWMGTKRSPSTLVGKSAQGADATVTVTAVRQSFNIPADLPIQLFNVIDNYADNSVLRRYLPAGVTLSLSNTDATRTNWIFQFTQGNLVDNVIVSCSEVSYNKLQLATQSDLFKVGRTLYKISDENQQQAFSGKFIIVSQSLFGFGKENPLTLTSYIKPNNFRKDSVVISQAFDIDKQSGVIMTLPYVAGASPTYKFSINLGISVSVFQQWNKKALYN